MKKIAIVFVLISLLVCNLYALVFPTARVVLENNNVNLGDVINVKFEIMIPVFLSFLQDDDRIRMDGWEIKNISFKRDFRVKGKYIVEMKVVTYDSSIKQIPSVKFLCVNRDLGYNEEIPFFSDAVSVNVNNIFSNNEIEGIRDIKSPRNLVVSRFVYILICLFVLFVVLVIYRSLFLIKLNKNTQLLNSFSHKEVFIREINRLLQTKNFSKSDIKNYYFRITSIFREFLLNAQNVDTQMTTREIMNNIYIKENSLFKYKDEIEKLFKDCEYAKYSGKNITYDDFTNISVHTKNIIEKY